MEINVKDQEKLVEIWLTGAEREDGVLQERLKPLYQAYRGKNYLVAVFCSGAKDLFRQTSDLLCYNQRRIAQLEVKGNRQVDHPSVGLSNMLEKELKQEVSWRKPTEWSHRSIVGTGIMDGELFFKVTKGEETV